MCALPICVLFEPKTAYELRISDWSSDVCSSDLGGFIRIEGAFNIVGLVNIGAALVVFAENGVWTISGGNSNGFTATGYKVTKITSSDRKSTRLNSSH